MALLVCKSWLRVSTPLLYHVVILRSKAQARALQNALRSNKDLGRFIKKLRVEGGFGNPVYHILQCAPNITDIFLSLHLHSSDPASGLALGLPRINPSRIIIYDDSRKTLKNKGVVELICSIESSSKKWTKLAAIVVPYADAPEHDRAQLIKSLCSRPSVKSVSFPHPEYSVLPFLTELAKISWLEAIEIRSPLRKAARTMLAKISTDSKLDSLLKWSESPTVVRRLQVAAPPPTDPSYTPMASASPPIVDRVWSRILFFAMLSTEPCPKTVQQRNMKLKRKNIMRRQCLFVCKTFMRVGLPYLYRYPIFLHRKFVQRFSNRLVEEPSLGLHVYAIRILNYSGIDVMLTSINLANVFHFTSRLTKLIGNGSIPLPWEAFTALAKTAGGTLVDLNGFVFQPHIPSSAFPSTAHSSDVFNHFTTLRSFTWKIDRFRDVYFSTEVTHHATTAFPALELLHVHNGQLLQELVGMELPSLSRVIFKYNVASSQAFLDKHGAKIVDLTMEETKVAHISIFTLCPAMTTFTYNAQSDFSDCYFWCPAKHNALKKLTIRKKFLATKAKDDIAWTDFISGIDFSHFIELREIQIATYTWPTTEHEISKNVLVSWAEELFEHDIQVQAYVGI
ncbi:hypothetical protein B0H10DRAFT_1967612 [Mycena sp. CBHHK59/15]|nr:hypothetical protein B0H10DRAFT_1967612 [Mycena sp. CBHHK59/15]